MKARKSTGLVVFFLVMSVVAHGQQKVEGRVVDRETGSPIPFASIGILGTAMGTSSNLDGEFTLLIPEGASIKVSCVGYVSLMVSSPDDMKVIRLIPFTIELNEIVVTHRPINARRVVQRALASTGRNYPNQSFLQQFFYRHYCKDDSVYGRLIEAFVDVWKHQGYKPFRKQAGDKEEIRVTHLRRSLDNTLAAQGHPPISIKSALQADVVAYQTLEKNQYLNLYAEVSNLKADFENYTFRFEGITAFDGGDVYKISYTYKEDSIATTSGYIRAPRARGMLYISTDNYAIVKVEDEKTDDNNAVRTSAYYRKFNGNYYPYHLIREGENSLADKSIHTFHIELMSVQLRFGEDKQFTGREPGKKELLAIPYDSVFWNTHTLLKATPIENEIIRDLGRGLSLNKQFEVYRNVEWSTSDGGQNALEKFNWYRDYSRGKNLLYLVFWDSRCDRSCIINLEHAKQLQKTHRKNLSVIMLSLDDDEDRWKEWLTKYNLFAEGIINYRIGSYSDLKRLYPIREIPAFILLSKNGEVHSTEAVKPGDPLLEKEIRTLLEQSF